MPRQRKKSGPRNISNARIAIALRKNGGIQAAAARVLKVGRSAICMRVANSPVLQRAVIEGMAELVDVAQDNIVRAIHKRDMVSTRWFLERRAPGYSNRSENRESIPPDPEAEARRANAMKTIGALIEERARLGLPPIFARPPEPKIVEIVDRTATRREGDDGTRVLPRR